MGQQTKAGFKPGSKGHFEAVVNPLKHSYDYDPANIFGNNPDVKAQQEKQQQDKEDLRKAWEKEKAKNETLKKKRISLNETEDETLEGEL